MAFQLSIPSKVGVNVTYHRIRRLTFNFTAEENWAEVGIESWLNRATRLLSNKQPVSVMPLIEFRGLDFDYDGTTDPRAWAYGKVKALADLPPGTPNPFASATDVLE